MPELKETAIRLGLRMLVKIPMTPNFLITNGRSIAIREFDNEELRLIGDAWTRQLIAKAEARRNRRKHA